MDIDFLIKNYESNGKTFLNNYLKSYQALGSINDVITCATMAKLPEGKKHFHQRRLKKTVMNSVKNKLLAQTQLITKCQKFDEIIKIVTEASEKGFGSLAIYDTALRIGSFFNIYPTEVYLHAGTLNGAKAMGLDVTNHTLGPNNLPNVFKNLKEYEVEDFLCIYKKQLLKKVINK